MTKVLVVDENPINTELAIEILGIQGFIAEGAQNGTEVIKKIEKEIYDLILTEIGIPGMDGIEVRKIIKSKSQYKHVPVIALTAHAMKGDRERILGAGFDDYIPKPIDLHDFKKKMEKYRQYHEKVRIAQSVPLVNLPTASSCEASLC